MLPYATYIARVVPNGAGTASTKAPLMKIVLDLQSQQSTGSRNRGIGRYSMALARAMIGQGGRHEFLISLNHSFPETVESARQAFEDLVPPEHILLFRIPTPAAELDPDNSWRSQAGELIRENFLHQLQPDWVYISSLFEGLVDDATTSIDRFAALPTAVTLYDLIPYIHSKHYLANPEVKSWYMRKLAHLRRAEVLLAISEHSRQEAIETLGIPDDRVVNISGDADARFQVLELDRQAVQALRARYGLSREFIMYTGGIDYRKNIERLIEAYACLPAEVRMAHQLAIVCSVGDEDRSRLLAIASRLGMSQDEVLLTGYVSDEDLVALLNLCKLFVFPSFHEGFGLPALEAMRCGAPVIGSNRSSIPEVIGLEAALFDPFSIDSICGKILEALTDTRFRGRLRELGRNQAGKFSWNSSAKSALEALETLHKRRQQSQHPSVQVDAGLPRPRLAYVSPLPPEQSGVANYSAQLLPELARYYEIDLITDLKQIGDPWLTANFRRRTVTEFERCADEYDRVLYHFGNSTFHSHMFSLLARHPGTVMLHDFFLSGIPHYLEATSPGSSLFRQALYRSHGYTALRRWRLKGAEEAMWAYPCCLEVLQNAQGVLVNSEHALRLAERFFGVRDAHHLMHIPQPRESRRSLARSASRAAVRLPQDAFIVCSFGFLGPTKLNHRLLSAWLKSDLAREESCLLVFVGEGHGGAYEQSLLERIKASGMNRRVIITGYAPSPEPYEHYLAAADVAVQLRTRTRGEGGRTPLDCLTYSLATVVNAHGTLEELPNDVVLKLPDEFTDVELGEALEDLYRDRTRREALGRAASNYMRAYPDAAKVARMYAEAIESFAQNHPIAIRRPLLTAVASLPRRPAPTEDDLALAAEAISENLSPLGDRQLLIDISELARRDSKAGIQRVTRNLLKKLVADTPMGYRLEPVYRLEGTYRYARQFMAQFLRVGELGMEDAPVAVALRDIFLGLDLDLSRDEGARNWLRHHGRRGLKPYFMCYDLLPFLRPDCFPPERSSKFENWLENLAGLAEGIVCTSQTVAAELGQWLERHQITQGRPLRIGYFRLGADIQADPETSTISDDEMALVDRLAKYKSILMVGTIEPTKGYVQALEALEALWATGWDHVLVIVGQQGWMVENFVQHLRTHPELNKRLFWIEDASDELLINLYQTASALLMASEGEGFALPLIEAAQHKLPIIARDIPVFREVAGDSAYYFRGLAPTDVAQALTDWLELNEAGRAPSSRRIALSTWAESAEVLTAMLLNDTHSNWLQP